MTIFIDHKGCDVLFIDHGVSVDAQMHLLFFLEYHDSYIRIKLALHVTRLSCTIYIMTHDGVRHAHNAQL